MAPGKPFNYVLVSLYIDLSQASRLTVCLERSGNTDSQLEAPFPTEPLARLAPMDSLAATGGLERYWSQGSMQLMMSFSTTSHTARRRGKADLSLFSNARGLVG